MSKIIKLKPRKHSEPDTGFVFGAQTKRRRITGPDPEEPVRGHSHNPHSHSFASTSHNHCTEQPEPHINPMLYPELCSDELLIEHLSRVLINPTDLQSKSRQELLSTVQTVCVPAPQRHKRRLRPPIIVTNRNVNPSACTNLSPVANHIRKIRLNSSASSGNESTPPSQAAHQTAKNGIISLPSSLVRMSNEPAQSSGPSPVKRERQKSPFLSQMDTVAAAKERFRTVDPEEFVKNHFDANRHTDEPVRTLGNHRDIALQLGVIGTSNGSAMVKQGNTTVICGVKAELQTPSTDAPNCGRIELRIDTSSAANIPEHIQKQSTSVITDLLHDGHIIDLLKLCVVEHKLVWILYCDVQFLQIDGAVMDTCLLSVVSALYNTRLPTVSLEAPQPESSSTEVCSADSDVDLSAKSTNRVLEKAIANLKDKTDLPNLKIKINDEKVVKLSESINILQAISFTFYTGKSSDMTVVVDPNSEELALYPASMSVVIGGDDKIYGIHRLSWKNSDSLHVKLMRKCCEKAGERHTKVVGLIEEAERCALFNK